MHLALAAAQAECRSLFRMVRTWLVIAVVFVPIAILYFSYSNFIASASVSEPTTASIATRFLIHSYGGLCVLAAMFGAIFLVFDARQRDVRDRVSEVLDAGSISNMELVAGRVLGSSFVALVPVWSFCLAAQCAVALDWAAGWNILRPFELGSFVKFFFLYAPLTVVAWCAVIALFAGTVRSRWAVALVSILVLCGMAWAIVRIPIYLYPIFLGLPGIGEIASDIVPRLPNLQDLQRCVGLVLIVVFVLSLTAAAYPRRDHLRIRTYLSLAGLSMLLAGTGYNILALSPISSHDEWRSVHRDASTAPVLVLEHVSGSMILEPGSAMQIEAELNLGAQSDVALRDVVFSLNPGLSISDLKVNGADTPFVHEAGLLTLESPEELRSGSEIVLGVVANGLPDPGFAYLESAIDPTSVSLWSSALHTLGLEGSVFADDYVALPPGVFWLPLPGANYGYEDPRVRSRDFYTVNLDVEVPDTWLVAAPGIRKETAADRPGYVRFQFRHEHLVPSVGLFASNFVAHSKTIAGIDFEILLHPRHLSSARFFADKLDAISDLVSERVEHWRSRGLTLPCDTFRLVEIPAQLRSYGGGPLMKSIQSMPCMFLLREHGFPQAGFAEYWERTESWQSDRSIKDRVASLLRNHFSSNYSGGNILAGINQNLFLFQTGVHGDGALEIELMLTDLLQTQSLDPRLEFFSPHAFMRRDELDSLLHSSMTPQRMRPLFAFVNYPELEGVQGAPFESTAVWEHAIGASWHTQDTHDSEFLDVAALFMRSATLATATHLTTESASVVALFSELRRRFSGTTMSAAEFYEVVRELEITAIPRPETWLNQREFPGFTVSKPNVYRLPDDVDGRPQYQTTVHMRNNESSAGTTKVSLAPTPSGRQIQIIPESATFLFLTVTGETSVECGWVSEYVPAFVIVEPVSLSLHGVPGLQIVVHVPSPATDDTVHSIPLAGHRPSKWLPQPQTGIIVDDLDEGFSTGKIPDRNVEEIVRKRTIGGIIDPDWIRVDYPGAWGTYRRTIATSLPNEGRNRAVFSVRLPTEGEWKLSYHVPEFHPRWLARWTGVRNIGFNTVYTTDASGTLRFSVRTAESLHEMDVVVPRNYSGWLDVGEFTVASGPVDVVVSKIVGNDDPYDVLAADAIRWLVSEGTSENSETTN